MAGPPPQAHCTICWRAACSYEPFLVAETAMAPSGSAAGSTTAAQPGPPPGVGAFRALAGYIFGGNARGEKMAMTIPVFTSGARDRMAFVLPARFKVGASGRASGAGVCAGWN